MVAVLNMSYRALGKTHYFSSAANRGILSLRPTQASASGEIPAELTKHDNLGISYCNTIVLRITFNSASVMLGIFRTTCIESTLPQDVALNYER